MTTQMDITPEICRSIQDGGKPNLKVTTHLATHGIRTARRRLQDALDRRALRPHEAFSLLEHAAISGAEHVLRRQFEKSRPLTKILHACIDVPDRWYRETAQHAASLAMTELRTDFTRRYGFPVITPESVAFIKQHAQGREVLEVGAGNGYLASLLTQAGLDIFPTDAHELDDNRYALGNVHHTTVLQCDAASAIAQFSDMTLLWSWPCPDDSSGQALSVFQGDTFIYIGEQVNGCTGGDLFSQVLDEQFEPVAYCTLPCFPPVHDEVGVYRRR